MEYNYARKEDRSKLLFFEIPTSGTDYSVIR